MKSGRNQKGSALIEFAGSMIVLTAMFAGIFQVSYTFFTYTSLVNAVRTGARYASLQSPDAIAADPQFAKTVANMVVYGEPRPAPGARPVVRGLSTENVGLVLGPAAATVSVHDFEIDALFNKVKLAGRPTVTFPTTGGASK